MRVIALSATLPNLSDIGEWLGCDCDAVHYFDESFRPVPLTVHTVAMGSMNNPYLFERSLDDRVHEVIARYSDRKQVRQVLSCHSCHYWTISSIHLNHITVTDICHDISLQVLIFCSSKNSTEHLSTMLAKKSHALFPSPVTTSPTVPAPTACSDRVKVTTGYAMQRSSGNALGTIRFQDSKLQDLGTTVDMSPSLTAARHDILYSC